MMGENPVFKETVLKRNYQWPSMQKKPLKPKSDKKCGR